MGCDGQYFIFCRRSGREWIVESPVAADELSIGRLFIHGRLNDPMTGGPLYCRILSFDAAWVEYEPIYHREDGSERLGSPGG